VRKTVMPKMMIELEINDKDGRTIEKRTIEGHSWVVQFLKFIRGLFSGYIGQTTESIKATDGLEYNFPYSNIELTTPLGYVKAGEGWDVYGIVVGTGTTPVDELDYKLESQIEHGTGSGQLYYGNTSVESISYDTFSFRIIRTFTNESGASIQVNEIGLIMDWQIQDGSHHYALLARDVLDTPANVGDGQTLTVRYIISLS